MPNWKFWRRKKDSAPLPEVVQDQSLVLKINVQSLIWDPAQGLYIWMSNPLGADERIWDRLTVSVTAGRDPSYPDKATKGDRIRMILSYGEPGDINLGNVICAATHKSSYADAREQTYALASVNGMDAERRSRLYIASTKPFTIHRISGKFRVTDAVVTRYRAEHGSVSMPDPEPYGRTFYSEYQDAELRGFKATMLDMSDAPSFLVSGTTSVQAKSGPLTGLEELAPQLPSEGLNAIDQILKEANTVEEDDDEEKSTTQAQVNE